MRIHVAFIVVSIAFLIVQGVPAQSDPMPVAEVNVSEWLGAPVIAPVIVVCDLDLEEGLVEIIGGGGGSTEQEEGEEVCAAIDYKGFDFGCPEPQFYKVATETEGCIREFPSFKEIDSLVMFRGKTSSPEPYRTTGTINHYISHIGHFHTAGPSITWYHSYSESIKIGAWDEKCLKYTHWNSSHSAHSSTKNHYHGTEMEAGIRSAQFSNCDTNGIAKGYWGAALIFQ